MNRKHRRVLNAIFKTPAQTGIVWKDIESLLVALGAKITEGSGSRMRVVLHGRKAVFHRPHPKKETDKGAVASMKKFLLSAGVEYVEL